MSGLTLKKESYHRSFAGWKDNLQKMFPDIKVIFLSSGEGPILIDADHKDFLFLYESFKKICRIEAAKSGMVKI